MSESIHDQLRAAQERVCKAILRQPMNPMGAIIAAYTNAVLNSARVDALVNVYLNPPESPASRQVAYEAYLLAALEALESAFEQNASVIQAPNGNTPPIVARVN